MATERRIPGALLTPMPMINNPLATARGQKQKPIKLNNRGGPATVSLYYAPREVNVSKVFQNLASEGFRAFPAVAGWSATSIVDVSVLLITEQNLRPTWSALGMRMLDRSKPIITVILLNVDVDDRGAIIYDEYSQELAKLNAVTIDARNGSDFMPELCDMLDKVLPMQYEDFAAFARQHAARLADLATVDRVLIDGMQQWNRSKLMIVGEGRAGKTALSRALMGHEFEHTESTADIVSQLLDVIEAASFEEAGGWVDHKPPRRNYEAAIAKSYASGVGSQTNVRPAPRGERFKHPRGGPWLYDENRVFFFDRIIALRRALCRMFACRFPSARVTGSSVSAAATANAAHLPIQDAVGKPAAAESTAARTEEAVAKPSVDHAELIKVRGDKVHLGSRITFSM